MLKFSNVNKKFKDGTIALDNVSLSIPKGEFCVVLGPSGAGKSTLLKLVNGMIEPTNGKINFDGIPIKEKKIKQIQRRIGMVHQQLHLVQRLSVINNVLSGALPGVPTIFALLWMFSMQYKKKACELLEQVGFEEQHLYRRASQFSGGQQQRIAIARAFILNPDLILADEPVASLDPVISRNILKLLKQASILHSSTVFCSLHQVELALEIADRIIGLREGKIVFDGIPDDLTADVLERIYENVPGSEPSMKAAESFRNLTLRNTLLDPAIKVEILVA
ncbi:phosphonate ABC transporter ATP-binding protein [Desulfobacterales bacterium HSG17]|nr:phosphonate ABC transporter ATP-binding protein [Desulfobacterales bacterium HSG17]